MRTEFLYWYPFDLRNSAKELVPNHLSFCIFHHAALFPPEHWPKAIGVNGMLMVEGQGMHKSKGNFITMKGAVEKYGADATRCGLLLGAEGMDDPDWRAENISDLQSKFEGLMGFASGNNCFCQKRRRHDVGAVAAKQASKPNKRGYSKHRGT